MTVLRLLLPSLLVVLGVAASPAHAGNGVVTRSADGLELRVTMSEEGDSLIARGTAPVDSPDPSPAIRIDENSFGSPTTITGSGDHGCAQDGQALICPRIHNGKAAQRLVVDFLGGDDFSEWQAPPQFPDFTIIQNGGPGADTLWGTARDDIFDGGPGPDSILGFRGNDIIRGGSGDDFLEGHQGADEYFGDDGFDEVDPRNADFPALGVHITIDDIANDGVDSGNEGDNVHRGVEDVYGTNQADRMIGDDAGNVLHGGGGNDYIDGGGGGDRFEAGAGDDEIFARDGTPERVICDAGNDKLIADDVDAHDGCETVEASPELQTDLDGDGVSRPADCDDGNPARRPGAAEVPDNGVDENCDGADAVNLDRDGDGSPRPFDCDDSNAAARPGGTELLGNRIDEDCSGRANPFDQILSTVPNAFRRASGRVRFLTLGVRDVTASMKIELRCSGRGCPFKRRTVNVRRKSALLNLLRHVRRARLRTGAKFEVRITRTNAIGKVVRFTVGRRGLPKSQTLCLTPGARRPGKC